MITEEKKNDVKKPELVKADLDCVGRAILYQLTDPNAVGPRECPALASIQLLLPNGYMGVLFVDSRLVPYLGAAYKVKIQIEQIGQDKAMEFLGFKLPTSQSSDKGVVV